MKRVLTIIVVSLLALYWGVALTVLNRKPKAQVCQRMELVLQDSGCAAVVTREEVAAIFRKHGTYPVGTSMDDIRTDLMEKQLLVCPLIERAECYKSTDATLCVEIIPRVPVMHVINEKGENFYIDGKGSLMPSTAGYVSHLPVATGVVDKEFAQKELYRLAMFLKENPFWNAQIEQIHVNARKELELVPRVGEHIVFLGTLDHFERKLERLKLFYEKALNQVGWNKYSRINLEFMNQIICTKKE